MTHENNRPKRSRAESVADLCTIAAFVTGYKGWLGALVPFLDGPTDTGAGLAQRANANSRTERRPVRCEDG